MAIPSGFFTIDDVTHVHLKQFPDEVLQPYVDEAEAQYIDLALQLGVNPEQINTPIPIVSSRYLNAYTTVRFSEDSIGTNNVEVSDDDMYVRMAEQFDERVTQFKKQITPELMMGVSENSRPARSVSTGKLYRTN